MGRILLTNGQLAGRQLGTYGHLINKYSNYLEVSGSLEGETIAHLFEALSSNGIRLQAIQKYFPSTWKKFMKTLQGV